MSTQDEESIDSIELFGVRMTVQDAKDFIDSFDDEILCSTCSTSSWSINFIPPQSREYLSIRAADEEGAAGKNHLPVFAMVCNCCGFIRLHAVYPLANWVRAKSDRLEPN